LFLFVSIATVPARSTNPLRRLLRFFFWHFYHGLAWTYDFVADVVSIGRWNDWMQCAIPFVRGRRVLEMGYGPGHLQVYLREQTGAWVAGLDESRQMARLAQQELGKHGIPDGALTRGLGQALPFDDAAFDTVIATFPTEYIFEPPTLHEIRRVLEPRGRFVIVPAAWIIGRKTMDRVAAWLFRITDQAPRQPAEIIAARMRPAFEKAGFVPEFRTVEVRSSVVLVVIARPDHLSETGTMHDQEVARTG
jgi:ubiquinone/menaquinone biosynthesis C-methylase UbiE